MRDSLQGLYPEGGWLHFWATTGWGLVMLAGMLLVAFLLGNLFVPVIIAFFLAYILDPIIDRFEDRGFDRTLGIVVFLSFIIIFLVAFVLILIPVVSSQTEEFARNLPLYIEHFGSFLMGTVLPWLQKVLGKEMPQDWAQFTQEIPNILESYLPDVMGTAQKTFMTVFTSTQWLLTLLISVILVPVFTFYFLRDFDKIRFSFINLFPRNTFDYWIGYFSEIDSELASVIRGQLTVSATLGVLYAIGLTIIGLPMGVLIGFLTGILAFIPYVGFSLGFATALCMALFAWNGPGLLIGVLVTFIIVQALDAVAITPRILGNRLRVSPVVIILALFVGGRFAGFVGVLLAVPVIAVIKVMLRKGVVAYKHSSLFLGEDHTTSEAVEAVNPALRTRRASQVIIPAVTLDAGAPEEDSPVGSTPKPSS